MLNIMLGTVDGEEEYNGIGDKGRNPDRSCGKNNVIGEAPQDPDLRTYEKACPGLSGYNLIWRVSR
jgi:hypothetical protein